MTIIKNLILPLVVILIIYAIPVVPTWRALKRKKASFGAFLGWIAGEMVMINILMLLLMFFLKFSYIFPVLFVGSFISSLGFIILPLALTSIARGRIQIFLSILLAILLSVFQIGGIFYLIAYSAAQIRNF